VRLRRTLLVLAAAPLLLAATDPRGDTAVCASGTPARGPDLVAVRGSAEELRTVAAWRLTFARPVAVPSDLRIDILVRDPRLAPVTVGDERGMNRIVRWEATAADAPVEIVWLPHDGSTTFDPPDIRGRTLTIVAPGRLLLGESVNGVESVRRARWSVVVRSGGVCDRLGTGLPTERLDLGPKPSPSPLPSVATPSPEPPAAASSASWVAIALILGSLAALPLWIARRRRPRPEPSSSAPHGTKPSGDG
jgi:hypothetical protein